MKYIEILSPISVNLEGKEHELEALAIYEYLNDSDDQFNRDAKGWRSSMKIDNELKKAKKEELKFLALEDEDWRRLKAAAEGPSAGYPIRPARRIQPFIDAIVDAKDSPPAVMKPREEDETT